MADERESLGRLVHEQRLAANAERERPFVLAPWHQRTPEQRELDMRIGEAADRAARARIAGALKAEGPRLFETADVLAIIGAEEEGG